MSTKTSDSKGSKVIPPSSSEVKCFGRTVSLPKLEQPRDVLKMLNLIMSRAAKGLLDPRLANCLFQGCNIALRTFEVVQNQEELEALSKRIGDIESKSLSNQPIMLEVR